MRIINLLKNSRGQHHCPGQKNATAGILERNFEQEKSKKPKREEVCSGVRMRCFFLNTTFDKNSNNRLTI